MKEAGVLIDGHGGPIYWHTPEARTAVSLPDSRDLWDVIWENRGDLLGFAHTHPGGGIPGPSHEDLTTFAAIESALGRRLYWWIASTDAVVFVRHKGPDPLDYETCQLGITYSWIRKLRQLSFEGGTR